MQKLFTKYQKLVPIIALLSVIIFSGFLLSNSYFLHIHKTVSGQTIVHSHAHTGTTTNNSGNGSHSHSNSEYLQLFIIGIISLIVFLIIQFLLKINIQEINFNTQLPVPEKEEKFSSILRAPPVI